MARFVDGIDIQGKAGREREREEGSRMNLKFCFFVCLFCPKQSD